MKYNTYLYSCVFVFVVSLSLSLRRNPTLNILDILNRLVLQVGESCFMDRSKKPQQHRGLPHHTSQLSPEPITASPFDFFEQQCPPVNFFCYSHNENSQVATGWKDGERDFCRKCYLSFSLSFWAASSWVFARPCPDGPLHWGTHSNINYPFFILLLSFFLQHFKILLWHHILNSPFVQ